MLTTFLGFCFLHPASSRATIRSLNSSRVTVLLSVSNSSKKFFTWISYRRESCTNRWSNTHPEIVVQVMVESFQSYDDFFDVNVSILLRVELSEEFLTRADKNICKSLWKCPLPQHWPPAPASFLRLSCLAIGQQKYCLTDQ